MNPPDPTDRALRRARIAWCFYDWANSAFPTVIVTFVFSAYFVTAVAENRDIGTQQWSQTIAISGLVIAILSPVLGAVADQTGRRKPSLAFCSLITIVAAGLLWYAHPETEYALYSLVCFAIANIAFEIGQIFYNAMLPSLAPPEKIGRYSGWAWGLGYGGGLTCLVFALFVFVQGDPPPFGLDEGNAEHVRVVGPFVAIWFAFFCLPLFIYTPDGDRSARSAASAVVSGLRTLIATIKGIGNYRNIAWFLLARVFYVDGMNTMFAFGGIYAAGTFGMSVSEVIQLGIFLNVAAGLGAAGFAWLDDRIGAKNTIVIALCGLIGFGVPLLLVESKIWFWIVCLPLGVFMGPAQAASRSLMARLSPPA
ncbi:MAG: MFS transporter, partial [Pseudomonadota bacterium]|nr:MFS transporter [Pseudomonadota bacterium]